MEIGGELLRQIRGTTRQREGAIRVLARHEKLRNDIGQMVKSHGGDADDGVMIFHDAIIAFVKKVFTEKAFKIDQTIEGYIYGIARFLWINERRKAQRHQHLPLENVAFSEKENMETWSVLEKQDRKLIHKVMDRLGKNCKEVLLFWAGGYSMKEVAEKLSYKSEGMVRKKKHHCLQSLIQLVKENPWLEKEWRE